MTSETSQENSLIYLDDDANIDVTCLSNFSVYEVQEFYPCDAVTPNVAAFSEKVIRVFQLFCFSFQTYFIREISYLFIYYMYFSLVNLDLEAETARLRQQEKSAPIPPSSPRQ